jgi:5-formyltetrahydrofolate cyclo-ligase
MKAELRIQLHARRNALAAEDRTRFSASITRSLLALDAYRRARKVMAYMTFGSEFMTETFLRDALRQGKTIVLPRIDRIQDRLQLHGVCEFERELAAGPWGIREPRPDMCRVAELSAIDFILVPGLGFTVRGDRLGYGRGYYDRLLADRGPRTALVAAAFSAQMVDRIPVGEHDIPVDVVITEEATYRRLDRAGETFAV